MASWGIRRVYYTLDSPKGTIPHNINWNSALIKDLLKLTESGHGHSCKSYIGLHSKS
jgi:hypothetical protein